VHVYVQTPPPSGAGVDALTTTPSPGHSWASGWGESPHGEMAFGADADADIEDLTKALEKERSVY